MSKKECRWCSPDWTKNKKIYKYKGHYYCEDCLLREVEDSGDEDFSMEKTTSYYVNGEYIGNDNELGVEDVIQELIDYGCDIVEAEEKETKRKVFSKEKFIKNMRQNPNVSQERLQSMLNDTEHWSNDCEGLTKEKINEMGYGISDGWMIEVDDETV